jgi:hypothetical protein
LDDQANPNHCTDTDVLSEAIVTTSSKRDRPEPLNPERSEAVADALERKESTSAKPSAEPSAEPSTSEPSASAVDQAVNALEGAVQGRVPDGDFIGRTVQTTVYGRNGGAIAQVGDTISQDQLERARREGVLKDLLEATDPSSTS